MRSEKTHLFNIYSNKFLNTLNKIKLQYNSRRIFPRLLTFIYQ